MKKLPAAVMLIPMALFLLTSCASGCEDVLPNFDTAQSPDYVEDASVFSEYSVREYPLTIPDGYYVGCIAGTETAVYYKEDEILTTSEWVQNTEFYRIDTASGHSERIYQINDGNLHWVNELVASDTGLFWVIRDETGMRIERLDFQSGQVATVKEFSSETPDIILTGGDGFVTWFEESGKSTDFLYACDDEGKEEFLISDQISKQSPFTRAYVNDGITAFVEASRSTQRLCTYDLQNKTYVKQLKVPASSTVADPRANRDYILWSEEDQKLLYTYDIAEAKLGCVANTDSDELYIFSFHLLGDVAMINDHVTNQIIGRQASGSKETAFTKQLSGDHYYMLGAVEADQCYIAYDSDQSSILRIVRS